MPPCAAAALPTTLQWGGAHLPPLGVTSKFLLCFGSMGVILYPPFFLDGRKGGERAFYLKFHAIRVRYSDAASVIWS